MAAPTVTASLDASTYSPGDPITLTVGYADPDTRPVTLTIVLTDSQGNSSAPVRVTAVIDPLTVGVADDSGRAWTKVSDTGTTAVYRVVA
ncbi:hypothetical protein GA0070216_101619 [Micromonospora matsumotoense]|uniref:Ig-like domain (Group 3) n=1 Tax=Micromonospora matsumotoense TaxID=121616 RepID=A0A1C4UMQ7_9ACTN|nr:hypothetical protein [Micromonospora matsumotoense]SCE72966.1 hypothetical protein GA0070216_101619 [Micromonospora matsumotoense]